MYTACASLQEPTQVEENLRVAKTDIAHCHHQLPLSKVNPVFLTPTSLQECFIPHCLLFRSRGSEKVLTLLIHDKKFYTEVFPLPTQSRSLKSLLSHSITEQKIIILLCHHCQPKEKQILGKPEYLENCKTKKNTVRS